MKDVLKKLVVFSLATFTTVSFLGCGLTDPEEADEVSISLDQQSIDLPKGNQAPEITATLEGSDVATLSVAVTDADGNDASGDLTVTPVAPSEKEEDVAVTVTAGDVCGDYKVTITATVGEAEDVAILNVTVTGCGSTTTPTLETKQVTLGSWDNTTGSSLDVDEMDVYKISQVTASVEPLIDVYYATDENMVPSLWSPAQAADAQYSPKSWATKNDSKFKKVSADFDAISTQEEIDALWSGSGVELLQVAAGDVVVVQTVDGNYALLKIDSATSAHDGTASVTGYVKSSS